MHEHSTNENLSILQYIYCLFIFCIHLFNYLPTYLSIYLSKGEDTLEKDQAQAENGKEDGYGAIKQSQQKSANPFRQTVRVSLWFKSVTLKTLFLKHLKN